MPPEPWTATYLEAAGSFADLVASLPTPLSGPGLGEWDLRALVGHTARSLVTVSEYLRKPAPSVDVETAADYVAGLAAVVIDPGITRRGVEAGELLGDDPAGAVRLLLDAVRRRPVPAPTPTRSSRRTPAACGCATTCPPAASSSSSTASTSPPPSRSAGLPRPRRSREAVAVASEVAVRRGEGAHPAAAHHRPRARRPLDRLASGVRAPVAQLVEATGLGPVQ